MEAGGVGSGYGDGMAILKIALMGHPVLRLRATEIADPAAPEVKALVGHMIDTMADADGMGLAAPQIHVPKRLVVMRTPGTVDEEGEEEHHWSGLTILANPVFEPLDDEREEGWEGCLSVPGLRGLVSRHRAHPLHGRGPGRRDHRPHRRGHPRPASSSMNATTSTTSSIPSA